MILLNRYIGSVGESSKMLKHFEQVSEQLRREGMTRAISSTTFRMCTVMEVSAELISNITESVMADTRE